MNEQHLPFWIVLRDPTIQNATTRHSTRDEAQAEAMRLCLKHNAAFTLCCVIPEGYAEPQPPKWVAL